MYFNKKIEEIEKELQTSSKGLSATDAQKRIEKHGKNILPKKECDSVFKIFINEFKDPIIILLLIAIIASLIVGEIIDALAIIFIVLIRLCMITYI